MPSDVEIYLCKYEHRESLYLRHFISSVSYCNALGTIPMDRLKGVIREELLDKLLKGEDVVVIDIQLIKTIVGKEPAINEYVVLKARS